jgi:hypothetical protein
MKKVFLTLILILALTSVALGQSGTYTTNGYFYEPPLGAQGPTEWQTFNNGLQTADTALAAAAAFTLGGPGCATLAAALTTIGSQPATLFLPAGTCNITNNTTIPPNIVLAPRNGAIITVATGKTLTINGPFQAGRYQIFSCAGTGAVVFANPIKVHVEWWGQTTAAFNAAINSLPATSGTVILSSPLTISADLSVNSNVSVIIEKGALLTMGTTPLSGTITYADTADGGTCSWDGTILTFSADQHDNFYNLQAAAGFINVNGQRLRPCKLLGDGTKLSMLQSFTGTFSNQAWSYSTQILTGTFTAFTTQLVAGDVITVNGEVFQVTAITNDGNVYIDHHPLAQFSSQTATRYYRLIFNGPVFIGNYQAFAGYNVSFTGGVVNSILPEWFGATGQYNPDWTPSANHDDTAAIQAAEYAATRISDTLNNSTDLNLHSKQVSLCGQYLVSKTLFMMASTIGKGERISILRTTIDDGSPTCIYNFVGRGSGVAYWGLDFRDYGVSGVRPSNTVGHLLGFCNYSRFKIWAGLVNYGIVCWENWSNRFDIDVYKVNYGLIVSTGGAQNEWHGNVEQPAIVGIDFSYNCQWGGLDGGSIDLLVEANYEAVPFQIGPMQNCKVNIWCEQGGGVGAAYVQGYGVGSEIINTAISITGNGYAVNFDYLKNCPILACDVPYIMGGANENSLQNPTQFPPLTVASGNDSIIGGQYYPYGKIFNQAINYWPNPFFNFALRGFKTVTPNNVTIALATDSYLYRMNGSGLKLSLTNGTSANYVEFELPAAVVAALAPSSSQTWEDDLCLSYWYYLPGGFPSTLTPGATVLYSTDNGSTYTTISPVVTNSSQSSLPASGGWTWQILNPVTSKVANNPIALPSNVTNIKIRLYGNTSVNNAGPGTYVVFSGIYFGRHNTDFRDLEALRWTNSTIAGYFIGNNFIFPAVAAPTDPNQQYLVGDEWRNSAPAAGGSPGGVCTTAGPGGTAVFKAMANLGS